MTAKRKWTILAAVVAIVAAAALYLLAYTGSTTIPGFHFTGKDGVVAVRADRLMIEGGFFKHPVLENAYIDAHAGPKKAVTIDDLDLKDVFSKGRFSSFPGKGSVIEARPAAMKIYGGKDVAAQIFASELEIDLKHRRLTFRGTARILAGNTLLIADRLTFLPEEMSIEAEGFALQKPDKRVEGRSLKTNVLLDPVAIGQPEKE